jgi:hypothetical protein
MVKYVKKEKTKVPRFATAKKLSKNRTCSLWNTGTSKRIDFTPKETKIIRGGGKSGHKRPKMKTKRSACKMEVNQRVYQAPQQSYAFGEIMKSLKKNERKAKNKKELGETLKLFNKLLR